MQTDFIILLGLIIAFAFAMTRPRNDAKPAWTRQLKGWQKLFGVIAVIATILIILNPEFLALGLLGDAAFFDMLILGLSLQMHLFVARSWRACITVLTRAMRWMGIPSSGLRYLMAVTALAMADAAVIIRKAASKFSSNEMA